MENVRCNCVNRETYQEDVMEQMSTRASLNLVCDDGQDSSCYFHREAWQKEVLPEPLLPAEISINFLKQISIASYALYPWGRKKNPKCFSVLTPDHLDSSSLQFFITAIRMEKEIEGHSIDIDTKNSKEAS